MTTTDPAPATPPAETGALIEQDKVFSKSILWDLHREYYASIGPGAWHSNAVPHFATCNAFIAHAYAKVVLSYLRDAVAAGMIDRSEPVYLVELAAGVGRFAYQFLKKFHALKKTSSLRGLDVRYVMTDFAEVNLKTWSQHPFFEPYLKDKTLLIGAFDVHVDTEIRLLEGAPLSAATVKNPMVVMGNYAFDSFGTDIFRVAGGQLQEVLVTTHAPPGVKAEEVTPKVINQLKVQYQARAARSDYYDDEKLNALLAYYCESLWETTITIPSGAFRALRNLLAISGRRMLVLSSDKGYTHEDELYNPGQHGMQFHGDCFSMMVNYHAVGKYFTDQGGLYTATSGRMLSLKTAACIMGGDEATFADTLTTFQDHMDTFGPGSFFELLRAQRQDCRSFSAEHVLGLLRISHWDPAVLLDHAEGLLGQVQNLPEPAQVELRLALEQSWECYFPGPQNLPFEMARIFLAMGRPQEGIRFNQISLEFFGDHPVTYLNMGICQYYAENLDEARRCFERSLELNPDFGLPKAWTARLESESGRRPNGGAGPTPLPRTPRYEHAPT